jgi:hypothetical protein
VVYTGPQGSGKTEALFGITELALSSTLWGLSFAEETKIGGNWEVLPLITIPDFKDEEAVRSYSSFEREVRNRIGLIAQYCEELPEGVRPLILMDEPLSSTNTDDASEGIRAIRDLVESKGGVLIIATHSHEAVWDMDKEVSAGGHQFDSKHVGLFDTEQAYKWLKGHGESMGIEVAKRNGMPHVAIEIAELVRDYIQLTGKKYPDISVVQAVAQNIKNVLEKYSL